VLGRALEERRLSALWGTGKSRSSGDAAVIVGHPGDEIVWAGGTILSRRHWNWHVLSVWRATSPTSARRFRAALRQLGAQGAMADLVSSGQEAASEQDKVQEVILTTLPAKCFDVILTHGPRGEYTRNHRHEGTCRAVVNLWRQAQIRTGQLWMFAYQDGRGKHLPQAERHADRREQLSPEVCVWKHQLVRQCYGLHKGGWQVLAAPSVEAFWCFDEADAAWEWLRREARPR